MPDKQRNIIQRLGATGIERDIALRRELPTYRPIYWDELPTGPERDALKAKQEDPTYRYFSR